MAMPVNGFKFGLDVLLAEQAHMLAGRRIGLLAHPSSIDCRGVHAATALHEAGVKVSALFGPEHGYFGAAGPGENVSDDRHPAYGWPVHSLYGANRRPTADMLTDVDVILFDLQDLAVRCYTFATTLRYVLEAAAEHGRTVIVADRPVPWMNTLDGPMLEAAFTQFVAGIPAPFVYGLTPAETARWLVDELRLDVDLQIAPMRGVARSSAWPASAAAWISPSPGIRTWATSIVYPATVLLEAVPFLDHGRGSPQPFELAGHEGLDGEMWATLLNGQRLPGVAFAPTWYRSPGRTGLQSGIRIHVHDAARFQPAACGVALLATLRDMIGWDTLMEGGRPDFFDKLMGTDRVRLALASGSSWRDISHDWKDGLEAFAERRAPHLLYPNPPA